MLRTDGLFEDGWRENGARERNRTANKEFKTAREKKENLKVQCSPLPRKTDMNTLGNAERPLSDSKQPSENTNTD